MQVRTQKKHREHNSGASPSLQQWTNMMSITES